MTGTHRRARTTQTGVQRSRFVAPLATVVVVIAAVGAACSPDAGSNQTFSPEAAEGRRLFNSQGCSGCHGANGGGGVGPPMVGLHMSERELTDGRTVIADDEYLTRSITDPRVDIVAGYSLPMPSNRLNDAQVAAIVAYIKELEPSP